MSLKQVRSTLSAISGEENKESAQFVHATRGEGERRGGAIKGEEGDRETEHVLISILFIRSTGNRKLGGSSRILRQ